MLRRGGQEIGVRRPGVGHDIQSPRDIRRPWKLACLHPFTVEPPRGSETHNGCRGALSLVSKGFPRHADSVEA